MRPFRNNNHKRSRFRSNDRHYKRNGEAPKFSSDYTSNQNFQRKSPGRNNHNASKLFEKYADLGREALSKGDKILSENYYQHADHFMRILNEQKSIKPTNNQNHNNQNSNNLENAPSSVESISEDNKKNDTVKT